MSIEDDFEEIMNHAHFWNWLPDWGVAQEVYQVFPNSYSVLTPFAYGYLEELIRSTTSEYGIEVFDEAGNPKRRKVGIGLINLAINELKTIEIMLYCLKKQRPILRFQHLQMLEIIVIALLMAICILGFGTRNHLNNYFTISLYFQNTQGFEMF